MSLTTTINRNDYTGDGATVSFAYTFLIFVNTDLQVYVNGVLKVLTTDYTVTNAGQPNGGNVVFNVAPGAALAVTLIRVLPFTRTSNYVDNDPFAMATLNNDLDKLTMLVQQINESVGRSLVFATQSLFKNVTFPDLTGNANKFLQVNAGATAILWSTLVSLGALGLPVSGANGGLGGALPASGYLKGGATVQTQAAPIPIADGGTGQVTANAAANALLPSQGGQSGKFLTTDGSNTAWAATSAGAAVPTGAILDFGGTAAPAGYVLCDGTTYDGTNPTYTALWGVIGNNYGGTAQNNFKVPDFRGRSGIGTGAGAGLSSRSIGGSGGEETHVLSVGEMPTHAHTLTDPSHSHALPTFGTGGGGGNNENIPSANGDGAQESTLASGTGITMANSGSSSAHQNMHPYLVATKIIKL